MYLLDTNVLSELRKVRSGKADPNVTTWSRSIPGSSLYLSVIVVQEIEIGIRQLERRDAGQAAILRQWLDQQVLPGFSNRDPASRPPDSAIQRLAARS